MAFQPRTFEDILNDMIAYVEANTDLTDFSPGSSIRTILEAAALEDDEQYFQMVQLQDAFSLNTAVGDDLDERAADYDLIRLQPSVASGEVVFRDGSLTTTTLKFSTVVPQTTITGVDTTLFTVTGPYTIRIGEGTTSVEDLTVNSNSTGTGIFTLSASPANIHTAGERISFVSGAADIALAAGVQLRKPSTGLNAAVDFVTIDSATIVNGNYQSTSANAKATIAGTTGNVGAGTITTFVSSQPFPGAAVTNLASFDGGRGLETDAEFRDRIRQALQSLSAGTPLALNQAVLGTRDAVTGQSVVTANVVEDFINDEVIVYIDDGTGMSPDTVTLASANLASTPGIGSGTITLNTSVKFPREGWIIISPEDPAQIELIQFNDVNYSTNVISLSASTTKAHNTSDEVVLVDMLTVSAEAGQNFFNTSKFPIRRSSERIWIDAGSGPVLQISGTNYFLNKATGDYEQTGAGIAGGAKLAATYTYYTGLVATAQRVLNGDPANPTILPGVRSAGVVVLVDTPTIVRVSVRIAITASINFTEEDLKPFVQEAIETYIGTLGIGDDVTLLQIEKAAANVPGVLDAVLQSPTSNIIVGENELPVCFDANGTSLVTVL